MLPDGAVFTVAGETYRKIHHNHCRAYVKQLSSSRHNVITKDDGTTVEFDSPGGIVNIAPESMVVQVDGGEAMAAAGIRPKRGGKPPQAPAKPAKRGGKRGTVLAKLLESLDGVSSIPKVAEELGMSRSLLLTHAFEIWRDHGVGYVVEGDKITVETFGGRDPFAEAAVEACDDLL